MSIIRRLILRIEKYLIVRKINRFLNRLWNVIYKTIFTFNLHGGTENAGYIAFSIIFAIFPFMIFFTIIIGYMGQTEIGIKLLQILETTLPEDIVKTLLPVIDNVINGPKTGILSIATLTLIWSASSLVQGIKVVLNKAFRIRTNRSYFSERFGSIVKFLIITIFIIISIFSTIVFPKMLAIVNRFVPIHYNPDNILVYFRPFLLSIFLFIFIVSIYYIIPSRLNKLRDIFWGSLLTLFGWTISLKVLTFYLQKIAKFQVVYGSLAGIIITLFVFHIMAMILIFGAEFNYNLREAFFKQPKFKWTKRAKPKKAN